MQLSPNQTAVVTGAGSGIGYAIARALGERGCRLALVDIRGERLAQAEREFRASAAAVTVHEVDVANAGAVLELALRVEQLHGRAGLLVNSAGVSHSGSFTQSDPADFDWVMDVNFKGTLNCCRAFLPLFQASAAAHIVNVSSCFGLLGFPGKSAYCASKFAVRGFSEALRAELRGSGIGVTLLYPGPVDTNIVRDGRDVDAQAKQQETLFLARRAVKADRVARATIRGIERDAARVLVGMDYRLVDLATRLAPTWVQALAARLRFPGDGQRRAAKAANRRRDGAV